MKLSLVDKIIIVKSLLPETGSIEGIKLILSIKNKLNLTSDELAAVNLNTPSVGMLQLNNVTEEMQQRNTEYKLSSEEWSFLKTLANNCSLNGWVTEFSLDTIEMLINYTE